MNKSWCVQWTHHQSQGSEEGGCLHASSSSNHVLYTICTSTHVYKYARSKHTITYKCICMKGNTERLGEEPINKSRKQTLFLSYSLTFLGPGRQVFGQLKVMMVTNCSLACHPFCKRHLPDEILAKILLRSESFTEQKGSCHEQGGGAQPQLSKNCVVFSLHTCFVLNWPIKTRKLHHAWRF